jgi:hypothetical protein
MLIAHKGGVRLGKGVTIIKQVPTSPTFPQCRRWTWVSTMFILVRVKPYVARCYMFSELIIPIGSLSWSLLGRVSYGRCIPY